jgi:hypothetical protein
MQFPESFVHLCLYVLSTFLSVRFFAIAIAENAFKDVSAFSEKQRKARSSIEQIKDLKNHFGSADSPIYANILKSQEPMGLPANLANYRRELAAMARNGEIEKISRSLADNRSWIFAECRAGIWKARKEYWGSTAGCLSAFICFFFDYILPATLLLAVQIVYWSEPNWLKYETLFNI